MGETVAGTTTAALTIASVPTIVAFPIAVSGNLPVGNIFNFGTTVYSASSLASYVGGQTTVFGNTPSAGAFLGLVTYSDGVHLNLIRITAAQVGFTNANVAILDMVDLVGTSITSVNANGFGFVL